MRNEEITNKKKYNIMKRLALFLALMFPLLGGAQTLYDYDVSIENDTWQSIASTGTRLTQVYNSYSQIIQLPFDIEFGQNTFYQGSNVKITGRGTVIFGTYGPWNYATMSWNDPNREYVVIPFFMGQAECPNQNNSHVYWLTRPDDRGGQELVVEWTNIYRNTNIGESVAYQVHVHSNGDIGVVYGPCTLSTQEDTLFTFAMVGGSTTDRVLITGNWNTSSSITKANPSNVSRYPLTPLMTGTPPQGLRITYLRPQPPCPHPTHLTVSGVQQEEATFSWTGNGVAGCQYKIQYDTVDFTPGSTSQGTLTVSDTVANLTYLAPGSHYYIYVRSDCGTDTSNWEGTDFWTSCNEMTHADLPYEQHFESTDGTVCWRKLGTVTWSSQQNVGGTTVRYCNMHGGDCYAIMPPMDYVNDLQVSFNVKSGPVMVGVMDSPSDTASFVPLQECWANNADWYPYTVRLSSYTGLGKYIAFRPWPNQYGVSGCMLDDVVLDYISGCIPPVNLSVARHNATSADITWRDYDSVGTYNVVWHSGGLPADSMTVSTDHCTITGLTPEYEYTVCVAIVCDSTTTSPYDTITFTTLPTCMTPVALYIDGITGRRATAHWTEMNTLGTYRVVLKETFGDTVSVDTVVADTTITFRNLLPNKQYRVDVSQLCSGTWTDTRWETFRTIYSCQGPQYVNADSVTSSTARITIGDTLNTGNHVLLVRALQAGAQTDTMFVNDTVLTLTGLATATNYRVTAATACSDSSFSEGVSITFATECSIITHADLPYVETFDNCNHGDAGSLSPCWTFRSYAPSNYVGLYKPTANIYHGTSGLSLNVSALSATEPMFVALPEADSLNDLVLKFWVYCTWVGTPKLDIGVMTDPTDSTTFTALQSYTPTSSNQWYEVEVPFSDYTGTGHYAALRAGSLSTTTGDVFYLDDFTLGLDLSCERPDSLIVDNVTDTSATLTIVPAAEADSDAVSYQVVLSSHYGNDTMIVTATTLAITGLVPATDYELEVRSECPEGGLTTAAHTQFTTDCGAYPLPYFEDFEYQPLYALPNCWELTDSNSSSPQVRDTWITPYSGRHAMTVSVYDSTFSSFATPWMRPTDGPVNLSFMAKIFNYRYLVDTTSLPLEVKLQTLDGLLTTLFSDKVLYTDWTELNITAATGMLAAGGRFVISVMQETDSNMRTGILQLDDISVDATCLPVAGVEVATSDTVPEGLTASWMPMGTESNWQVHIWNSNTSIDISATQPWIVLTDIAILHDSTDYWLTVIPICGEGDTGAYSDTVVFHTPEPLGINSCQMHDVNVYPNPARGKVTVEWVTEGGEWSVELLDVSGRVCESWNTHGDKLTINVSHLSRGAYFLRVTDSRSSAVRKIMLINQ